MNAVEMDNRGVIDLMSAMTALAYDDYVNGAILLNESEYEEKNGVIKLISVKGKSINLYNRAKKSTMNSKIRYYCTAKKFLEGTRLGDYLIEQAQKDIEKGKHRGVRKTVAFDAYEGVQCK